MTLRVENKDFFLPASCLPPPVICHLGFNVLASIGWCLDHGQLGSWILARLDRISPPLAPKRLLPYLRPLAWTSPENSCEGHVVCYNNDGLILFEY